MKASERQKLKHDKYADTVMQALTWARAHQTPLMVIVAAVLVVGGAVAWTVYSRQQAQKVASDLLTEIETRAQTALMEKPENRAAAVKDAASRLENLASSYPDTDSAPLALLKAAQLLSQSGQKKEAIDCYTRVLDLTVSRLGLAAIARRGLAECLEDTGSFQAAIQQYKTFTKDSASQEAVHADWDIGRCYEASGDYAKAKEFYQKAVDFGGDSSWANLARFRLSALAHGVPAPSLTSATPVKTASAPAAPTAATPAKPIPASAAPTAAIPAKPIPAPSAPTPAAPAAAPVPAPSAPKTASPSATAPAAAK